MKNQVKICSIFGCKEVEISEKLKNETFVAINHFINCEINFFILVGESSFLNLCKDILNKIKQAKQNIVTINCSNSNQQICINDELIINNLVIEISDFLFFCIAKEERIFKKDISILLAYEYALNNHKLVFNISNGLGGLPFDIPKK